MEVHKIDYEELFKLTQLSLRYNHGFAQTNARDNVLSDASFRLDLFLSAKCQCLSNKQVPFEQRKAFCYNWHLQYNILHYFLRFGSLSKPHGTFFKYRHFQLADLFCSLGFGGMKNLSKTQQHGLSPEVFNHRHQRWRCDTAAPCFRTMRWLMSVYRADWEHKTPGEGLLKQMFRTQNHANVLSCRCRRLNHIWDEERIQLPRSITRQQHKTSNLSASLWT